MQEYKFYKICIKKGNQVFTEPVYFRTVTPDDTDIIKEEHEQESIEYNLEYHEMCLEASFDIEKYITDEEYDAMYGRNFFSDDEKYPVIMLSMISGTTFSQHITRFNYSNNRIKSRENFLSNICSFINSYCKDVVATWENGSLEDEEIEQKIKDMYKVRPDVQCGLEDLLNVCTDGYIDTDYIIWYGDMVFDNLYEKYGPQMAKMTNYEHGPNCLYWNEDEERCSMYGVDYIDKIKKGGFCYGPVEELITLIEICIFVGPKALMYYGQKNNIDYKIIYYILEVYGEYYEEGKYEKMIKRFNIIKENAKILVEELNHDYIYYLKMPYEDIERILKNYHMFKRWDLIRQHMASEEILIAKLDDCERPENITDDRIVIMRHGEYPEYPNYYWWEQFHTEFEGGNWDMVEANPDFTKLIDLRANIKWVNNEMLDNLEQIYS